MENSYAMFQIIETGLGSVFLNRFSFYSKTPVLEYLFGKVTDF